MCCSRDGFIKVLHEKRAVNFCLVQFLTMITQKVEVLSIVNHNCSVVLIGKANQAIMSDGKCRTSIRGSDQ